MRRLARIALTLLVLYLGYGALMVWAHPTFLYPFRTDPDLPAGFVRQDVPGASVSVVTAGEADGPVVLFFMGNAGAVSLFDPWLDLYRQSDRHIVAMEYRGGGGRTGQPSEAQLKADALATYDWLTRTTGKPVVVHGFSLGSGLAVHVAARRDVAGVVLEAPFARLCDLMARASLLPACLLPVQRWDNLADLDEITAPVLILHGAADRQIPISEAERIVDHLGEAGRGPTFQKFPDGRHNDLFRQSRYGALIGQMLDAAQAP